MIHLKKAYTKIEKTYPKTGNNAKLNADGTLNFTVTLTPDADMKELTVTDTLGSGFTFIENSFVLKGYAQSGNANVRVDGNTAEISLGEVRHDEKPVITYKVKVLEVTGQNPYQNTAECNWKAANDSDGKNSAHVEVILPASNPLVKTGSLTDKEKGIITWTVLFNSDGVRTDLAGAVFTDTLGAHQQYIGKYMLKNEASQEVAAGSIEGKKTFTCTFLGRGRNRKVYPDLSEPDRRGIYADRF